MGIRFFCPNGHKLNVKEHLAGKAGFCPECGARLIIPLQSTRKSSKELNENPANSTPVVSNPVAPAATVQPEPLAATTQPIPKSDGITNPILQDQTVVWYVQVPGGPQYGPATGQMIHTWIQEHRIEPTMLVWREGWTNWLEAKNVFTELENIAR
ncbi:MAG: DUF4339 domain-containing protein [Planctomycetaceae bacterium]|jgi:predicted RNA-binding Zn-ribbon protein involved in translation (DUF1610 family)|nr:DUF4339 domain-containing protein [Planctomycetaceae bacterium]